MIEREAALRTVEAQLEGDYLRWRATEVDPLRMAVVHVEEHELVWIVSSWTSEEFVRTGKPEFRLVGNARTWSTMSAAGCIGSASSPR
ncbi:YrhB domain-containing protein [Streptomyces globisporus]